MEMNLGRHGATRGSWERDAIRVIFRELQKETPKDANNWRKMSIHLLNQCQEDSAALGAACDYIAKNLTDAQEGYEERLRSRVSRTLTPQEREQRREEDAKAIKEYVAKILYLNMEMPNGKRMRFCPGNYVAKVCAPLARLGKKAGNKLMGAVYNEDDIRSAIGE